MYLLRDPWKYEFVETDDGLLIIRKDEIREFSNIISLDEVELEDEASRKPWTFMIDGMEHMYQ